MPLDLDIMASKLGDLLGEIPVNVGFEGSDYVGTKTTLDEDRRFAIYGDERSYEFSVCLSYRQMGAVPDIGDEVTVSGSPYRVTGKALDPAGLRLRIDLGVLR